MKFAIFGMGNIGIPLACIFASISEVIGVDIDKKKVEMINKGVSPLPNEERVPELLRKHVNEKRLIATTDLEYAAKNSDVKVIIVPLILKNEKIDFSAVENVSRVIGRNLKKNDLIIVSTTMPLGATRNVVGKILEEESNLKAGEDFYLVYAPERTMNPHVIEDLTEKWHQIIGGVNEKSAEVAKQIYEKINKKGVIIVKNCETAEMIKLLEGIYRYTNIALANEIAKLCDKFKIDFNEVRETFNLIPYYNLHFATIGVGGHCIPVYPHFVLDQVEEPDLIKPSIKLNRSMPEYCIEKLKKAVGNLRDKKIAILGLSYKGDVKEDRFSVTYEIIKILKENGITKLFLFDPYFTKNEIEEKTGLTYIDLNDLSKVDGVIIATEHESFKRISFPPNIEFILDGKNILNRDKILKLGIKYIGVGR